MEAVLSYVKRQGLFFVDSRTTAHTVAPSIARGSACRSSRETCSSTMSATRKPSPTRSTRDRGGASAGHGDPDRACTEQGGARYTARRAERAGGQRRPHGPPGGNHERDPGRAADRAAWERVVFEDPWHRKLMRRVLRRGCRRRPADPEQRRPEPGGFS